MKRRISDMLDHYRDDTVTMEHTAPLSSERIRELTISKINQKDKKGKRSGFRILVAAAIIAALSMTAFAAEEIIGAGDWFQDILNAQLEKERIKAQLEENEEKVASLREAVSAGQLEVVNDLGRVFNEQTQTSQGTTVTMHAAYGDAHILHLYFTVEAPEGTVLPDDIFYTFHDGNEEYTDKEDRYLPLTPDEDAPYKTISQQVDIEALPDEDPNDNKKDFHVLINGQAGDDCSFNDGYSKFFNIRGIWQQIPNVNMDEDGFELLAPGEFSFDVGLPGETAMLELKEAEGFVYGGAKTRTWTHDSPCHALCEENLTGETDPETGLPIHSESWVYEVTVKKLSISPMSVEWEVEYTCDNDQMDFGLDFQVVMKDGTSPMVGSGGSMSNAPSWLTGGVGKTSGLTYFSVPIDLEEVDYILIGDEELGQTYKIYLPE